jgi:hypothetical protein
LDCVESFAFGLSAEPEGVPSEMARAGSRDALNAVTIALADLHFGTLPGSVRVAQLWRERRLT